MSDDEIRKALQALCAAPVINKVATVVSVDLENYTATVLPEGEAELDEVRLKAGIDGVVDGIVEVPEVNSDVLISLIGNDPDNAYIAKCSKVQKIIMFGGELGGLIKIEEMLTQLNNRFNLLKAAAIAGYTAQSAIDGSAGLNAYNAAITTLINIPRNVVEDVKVLH